MSGRKFLIVTSLILAVAVAAWSSGGALAQQDVTTKDAAKEKVTAKDAAKKQVTIDDVLKSRGKVTPSEQKAAAKRAKELGVKPGVAGPAAQAPESGGAQ
jgi:ABC-type Fe3+-hydroxamate transport system substrate-binding protein